MFSTDLTTVQWVQILFGALYSIIFVLGLLGNSLVVISIIRYPPLQTVRNIFIIGLSASDLMAIFASVLITPIIALIKEWHLGSLMCKMIPLFQGMCLCFSTFTLASIAIDRYILIVHPTKSPLSRRHAILIILLNLTLSFVSAVPVSWNQQLKSFEELGICGSFCMETWKADQSVARLIYGLVLSALSYFLPLAVIVCCYYRIGKSLKKRCQAKVLQRRGANLSVLESTGGKSGGGELQSSTKRMKIVRRHRRTNRMLVSMVVMFAVSWFPFMLLNSFRDLDLLPKFMDDHETFSQICTHILAVTSTVWNPILYAFLNEHFRTAFLKLISTALPCLSNCIERSCSGGHHQRDLSTTAAYLGGSEYHPPLCSGASKSPVQLNTYPTKLNPVLHPQKNTNNNNSSHNNEEGSHQKSDGGLSKSAVTKKQQQKGATVNSKSKLRTSSSSASFVRRRNSDDIVGNSLNNNNTKPHENNNNSENETVRRVLMVTENKEDYCQKNNNINNNNNNNNISLLSHQHRHPRSLTFSSSVQKHYSASAAVGGLDESSQEISFV